MSEPAEHVFKGDRTRINEVDLEAPLATAPARTCEYYMACYGQASRKAQAQGNDQAAATYAFLDILVSFSDSYDSPDQPYSPFYQGDGKRSLIPSDLSPDDIEALRVVAPLTSDAALRARLHDVLWLVSKDFRARAEAADCFLASAKLLDTPDQWVRGAEHLKRALQLAAGLGRTKDLYKSIENALLEFSRNAALDNEGFRFARYLSLIKKFVSPIPDDLASLAEDYATRRQTSGDFYQSKAYWIHAADLYRKQMDQLRERAARTAAVDCDVAEAEKRMNGPQKSAMAAAHFLVIAIEALRRIDGHKGRIEELKARLRLYQAESRNELKLIQTPPVDISEIVSRSIQHVEGYDFRTTMFRYVLGIETTDLTELRKSVEESSRNSIVTLMPASHMDEKGRTILSRPGILGLSGDEMEKELEAEMFAHASRFLWPFNVVSYIEPGRVQIVNQHHPRFEDLLFIVADNPFIPPGHEGIFLRGLHAGFHGDFLLASHLLTPQIENSIRYVLESQDVDVANLLSDRTQPVKILGPLLDMSATAEIFGEGIRFELRGLLIEKTGYDFRNRVAHGFVSEGECHSTAAKMIWWLVLRLCLAPIWFLERQKEEEGADQSFS